MAMISLQFNACNGSTRFPLFSFFAKAKI